MYTHINAPKELKSKALLNNHKKIFSLKCLLWHDLGEDLVLDVHAGFPMTNGGSIQNSYFNLTVIDR